jgi:hypothetical protein
VIYHDSCSDQLFRVFGPSHGSRSIECKERTGGLRLELAVTKVPGSTVRKQGGLDRSRCRLQSMERAFRSVPHRRDLLNLSRSQTP